MAHGLQFFVHHAIEVDGCRTFLRTEKAGRIVVDTDGQVVLPIVEATGLMTMMFVIISYECLHAMKILAQPFGIVLLLLDEESGVLRNARFVHVGGVNVGGLDFVGIGFGVHHHGHVAIVGRSVVQVVEHAALFVAGGLASLGHAPGIGQNLTQRHIGPPGIPVPKHGGVLLAARRDVGIFEGYTRRLAVHVFEIAVDVFLDEFTIHFLLAFAKILLRHQRQKKEPENQEKRGFIHEFGRFIYHYHTIIAQT